MLYVRINTCQNGGKILKRDATSPYASQLTGAFHTRSTSKTKKQKETTTWKQRSAARSGQRRRHNNVVAVVVEGVVLGGGGGGDGGGVAECVPRPTIIRQQLDQKDLCLEVRKTKPLTPECGCA